MVILVVGVPNAQMKDFKNWTKGGDPKEIGDLLTRHYQEIVRIWYGPGLRMLLLIRKRVPGMGL